MGIKENSIGVMAHSEEAVDNCHPNAAKASEVESVCGVVLEVGNIHISRATEELICFIVFAELGCHNRVDSGGKR